VSSPLAIITRSNLLAADPAACYDYRRDDLGDSWCATADELAAWLRTDFGRHVTDEMIAEIIATVDRGQRVEVLP
jgi:hypothetical protein